MRLLNFSKQLLLASCFTAVSFPALASISKWADINADPAITRLYEYLNHYPSSNLSSRIKTISAQFLGRPYLLGALGEGVQGRYNQKPLYRTDAFDCETYVDTVIALALANHLSQFKQCINQVRYKEGQISFTNRNHFTCLDWNKNNQRQGFVKDITQTIREEHQQAVIKFARATINKPSWYAHFSLETILLKSSNITEKTKRLHALKQEGRQLSTMTSIIPYLPLSVLFDASGKANQYVFDQIPDAAIIEIVRPNWDLQAEIGTHLNVSHLGFAIKEKGGLFFRAASSIHHQVQDVPLIDYLREAQKNSTIKGINLQIVLHQDCGQ